MASHDGGPAVGFRRSEVASALPLAPGALVVVGIVVGLLLLLAGQYGWHRDELYFVVAGRHPAFGYPDQPPITPLLAAAGVAILGPGPVAVRALPALAIGLAILLAVDIARRFGGGPRAQVITAASLAATGYLLAGHLASTATFDILAWTVILWLLVRILAGGDPRLWLALGAVVGLGFENKHLVAVLGVGLVLGMIPARRWEAFRSPWAWAGVALAAVIALPNVAWQATNGWPAMTMARAIARDQADRGMFVVELVLLAGFLVAIVPILGIVRLLVRREAAPWRAAGWAAIVVVGVTFAMNGKAYYVMGLLGLLVAAGAVELERWLARGRTLVRPVVLGVAVAACTATMALLTLPIVPAGSLASTPIPDLNGEQIEQIGWPELVAVVREAVLTLPEADRADAVILTSNYGEAGAIELLGPDLPPVYSGHNGYWDWGPPPDGRSAAILVGQMEFNSSGVGDCSVAGYVRNGAGVENQEYGAVVRVCHSTPASWAAHWKIYRHLD